MPRSARLELRVTPAEKELIHRGAALKRKSISAYAVDLLVGGAQRDAAAGAPEERTLGWMRGTATIIGDIVGPTDPDGWEPGELPR